jgi:hypothetical protein
MTNDEKDRHVVAVAVMSRSQVIVTSNIQDFPDTALDPFGISAQTPDEFLNKDKHSGVNACKSYKFVPDAGGTPWIKPNLSILATPLHDQIRVSAIFYDFCLCLLPLKRFQL